MIDTQPTAGDAAVQSADPDTAALDAAQLGLAALEHPEPEVTEVDLADLDPSVLELAAEAAAIEARSAAPGSADAVGPVLHAVREDEVAVTIAFEANVRGYAGWLWSVTVAHVQDDAWTVSEVVLLPGAGALVAPEWVPWDQRVRGGDLGVGDLLPTPAEDPRLVPGYVESDDPAVEELAKEVGLGRVRVLSRDGRLDTAERWHDGEFGPDDPMAQSAPGRCGQCGFFLPLAGSLGGSFGGCANEFAPGDGRIVAVDYGCGAHSEAVLPLVAGAADEGDVLRVDEVSLEVHARPMCEPSVQQAFVAIDIAGEAEVVGAPATPDIPAAQTDSGGATPADADEGPDLLTAVLELLPPRQDPLAAGTELVPAAGTATALVLVADGGTAFVTKQDDAPAEDAEHGAGGHGDAAAGGAGNGDER